MKWKVELYEGHKILRIGTKDYVNGELISRSDVREIVRSMKYLDIVYLTTNDYDEAYYQFISGDVYYRLAELDEGRFAIDIEDILIARKVSRISTKYHRELIDKFMKLCGLL